MFSFNVLEQKNSSNNFNLSLKQYCDKINVGPIKFYRALRELGVFYSDVNEPTPDFQKYFIANDSWYTAKSGKESYYITLEGQVYIKSLFSEDELKAMAKSKFARQRKIENYKYY